MFKKHFNNVSFFIVIYATIASSCNFPRYSEKTRSKNLVMNGFKFYDLNYNGNRRWYYKISNKSQTIILLHGFGADGITQWFKTAKLLSRNYNVIVPDLLNHGKSFDSVKDYSILAQAEYVNQIIDTLKIATSVSVLGNSYGGLVATEFSYLYPAKTNKLILNDAVNRFFSQEMADSVAQSMGYKKVIQVLSPINITDLKKTLGVIYYRKPYIPRFILKQLLGPTFNDRQVTNQKILQHLIDNESYYQNRNYSFNKNTYLIWGSNDRLIPVFTAKRFLNYYKLDTSQLYVISKSAHAPNMEHPKEFCKIINEILAK